MATATTVKATHEDAVDRIEERIDRLGLKFAFDGLVGHLADQAIQIETLEQRVVGLTVLLNKDNTRIGETDARVHDLLRRVARLEGRHAPAAPDGLDPGARSVMAALDAADDLARAAAAVISHFDVGALGPAGPSARVLEALADRSRDYRLAASRAVQ